MSRGNDRIRDYGLADRKFFSQDVVLPRSVKGELTFTGTRTEKRDGQRWVTSDLDHNSLTTLARENKHDDFPVLE